MYVTHKMRWLFVPAVIVFVLLMSLLPAAAQGTPTPINIGENKTGEVSAATPTPRFSLTVAGSQTVTIQVLALTQGFAPTFQVIDPLGINIVTAANPTAQAIIQANANLMSPGAYSIDVFSANGVQGQFVISIQASAPAPAPIPLSPGQAVPGMVNAQGSLQQYTFAASQLEVLLLSVRSDLPNSGPVVALRDAQTGEVLALSNMKLIGARYRIPVGVTNYVVQVMHSGAAQDEPYVVCLETESGSAVCPATPGIPSAVPTFTPVAPISPSGACAVTPSTGQAVNVRSGPGTTFNIVAQLPVGASAQVIGRLADNSWWQVTVNGVIGWVASSVTQPGGDCTTIPVVVPPPSPVPTLGPTPTFTATIAPTFTPSPTPTETPTMTPTATPTDDGVDDGPIVDIPIDKIDVNLFKPDLRVASVSAPNSVNLGQNVTVSANIVNDGVLDSGAFMVWIDLGGVPATANVANLAPGATTTVTVNLVALATGNQQVTVIADFGSQVAESDESNNQGYASVNVELF